MARILICLATGAEASACLKGLKKSGQSEKFEVLKTGMGHKQAHQKLKQRLNQTPLPLAIVSSGLAGSVDPALETGSWAWGSKLNFSNKNSVCLSEFPNTVLQTSLHWKAAVYQSVSTVHLHEKASPLISSTQAVDMESEAWFALAAQRQIPFAVLRLISDSKKNPLPRAVQTFSNALLEDQWKRKILHTFRGSREIVSHPLQMGRFVLNSVSLLENFSEGWCLIAKTWPPNFYF